MFASKDQFFTRAIAAVYQLTRSLRFRASATAYLNRTFGTPTSTTIWTWSAWVKRGGLGGTYRLFGASTSTYLTFNSSDQLNLTLNGVSAATSTAVFRDPSSWYHIVYQQNGSAQTIYVNNSSVATGTTAASIFNTAISHQIAAANTTNYFDGYLAEINFIDGQALTPSSFGQSDATTGVWVPKKYSGTYGANGFYLPLTNTSSTTNLVADSSGNGNDWTPNNISLTAGTTYDSMIDVPYLTGQVGGTQPSGNYATLNPVIASAANITNGNLTSGTTAVRATMDALSFNSYWEVTAGASAPTCGVISGSGTTNTTTVTANKVFGFRLTTAGALDYINITDSGSWTSITTGLTASQFPYGITQAANWNFGQRPFTGTVPSTYSALCAPNLAAPTIKNGAGYMAATTYTGTGASQSVTNTVGSSSFKPDLVWIKSRSAATNNNLFDAIRGTTNYLISNSTAANASNANTLTAFNSNGFTVGTDASSIGVNVSAATYVGWQWLAGAGTTSSNTNGSITSTVCVNTTSGFSVVTYTGSGANSTIGHGLGVAPQLIITKNRSSSAFNWGVYHASAGNTGYLKLNLTDAFTTQATWQNTSPTSTVFYVGNFNSANQGGDNYVAYCFAPIAGYSAFGSYTGNGSTDGPFVYCGFRPRWVMVKRTDSTSDWYIWDTSRDTYNVEAATLLADTAGAETSATSIDDLSNGFKCRSATVVNASSGTYIYAAFAENPFNYSNAR